MLSNINFLVGPQEPLLATVKRRNLAWFGQVSHHDSLSKTILQFTMEVGDAVVAEEMLDGQPQRVDSSASARAAHKVLRQKTLEEDLC